MLDFDSLTNDEIRNRIIAMGKQIGPVNDSNRKTYIKMLTKSPSTSRRTSPTKKTKSPTAESYSPPTSRNKSPANSSYSSSVTSSGSRSRRNKSPGTAQYSFDSSYSPSKRNKSPATTQYSFESSYSPTKRNKSPATTQYSFESSSPTKRNKSPSTTTYSSTYSSSKRDRSPPASYYSDNSYSTRRNVSSLSNSDTFSTRKPYTPLSSRGKSNYSEPPFVVPVKKKGAPGFVPPVVAGFLFFMALLIFYYAYSHRINEGVASGYSAFTKLLMFCYTYAVIPIVAVILISLAAYAMYYLFNIHKAKTLKYQEELRGLIKDMLRHIRKSGVEGLPIRQLRDKMIPAYTRTPAELKMWNEAENFIKEQDTRVRTEERLINDADIAEYFVWSAPFSDDYE